MKMAGCYKLALFVTTFATLPLFAVSDNYVPMPDGSRILQARGEGVPFGAEQCHAYGRLKSSSLSSSPNMQWSLQDLDNGVVVDGSSDEQGRDGVRASDKRFFGASTSKMFVAAALLDAMGGKLTAWQLDRMKMMIIVSNNQAWHELQAEIGAQRRRNGLCSPADSNKTCGQQGVAEFTRRMGCQNTRAFSGSLHGVHGNELNAKDTNKLLAYTYKNRYAGAGVLWNIMQGVRTGSSKAKKYIPSHVTVGGKTGTYDGPTVVNGEATYVQARNQAITFKGSDGHQYGLTILNNDGRDETVALLAGGIVREYTGLGRPCSGAAYPQAGSGEITVQR